MISFRHFWCVLISILIVSGCHRSKDLPSGATKHSEQEKSLEKVEQAACPGGMVLVDGDYCPNLQVRCLYNVDANGNHIAGLASPLWACGEYQNPTVCKSVPVHMRFCMDRYEWPNIKGQVPKDWMSFTQAKKELSMAGKRLCTAKEWTLAAEGPNRHPLPYSNGYHRDSSVCNFDRHYTDVTTTDAFKALGLHSINVEQARTPNDKMSQALRMFLVPSGSMPDCHSDYGVYDMAGNVDELVLNEGGTTCINKSTGNCISGLKGGHVWHVRNASRPMTTAHGEGFGWYETGARACSNTKDVK